MVDTPKDINSTNACSRLNRRTLLKGVVAGLAGTVAADAVSAQEHGTTNTLGGHWGVRNVNSKPHPPLTGGATALGALTGRSHAHDGRGQQTQELRINAGNDRDF